MKRINIENGWEGQKIFQYADDTTLIIEEVESIKIVMELMQKFCKVTGIKINVEKKCFYEIWRSASITSLHCF